MLQQIEATRFDVPLREGGSLPGIVEADDLGTYVCKFRGAGQGLKVLVAEVVVGELARLVNVFARREIGRVIFDGTVPPLDLSTRAILAGISPWLMRG